jgi:formylglycine-generating enzyme required for sulfatase activity
MKKLLIVALVLNVSLMFLAVRLIQQLDVAHGGAPPPDIENGDVNGSGQVDIADASFLLNFLFLGGREPVACAQQNGDLEIQVADLLVRMAVLELEFAPDGGNLGGRVSTLEGQHPVDWNTIVNLPADFADEVDNVGLTPKQEAQLSEAQMTADAALTAAAEADGKAQMAKDDLATLERFLLAGFIPIGMNPETGLEEYRHVETGIDFVLLPGGTFEMGSPGTEPNRFGDGSEGPVHTVTLDPFLIAKTEVTQAEYEAVMGSNPSSFTGDDQRPVEQVSWNNLHARDSFLARTGFGLPSEAQWEYAARGGTSTAFSFGDDCNSNTCDPCATAENFMWWCANSGSTTRPVGTKQPNPFGLFDMHGNVWEWCEDVYDSGFYGKPEAAGPNPVATSGSGLRVFRGGGWPHPATFCRSADRFVSSPGGRSLTLGFRPARPLP